MTVTAEAVGISERELANLIKQAQSGNEVLLTQDNKPVARIIPAVHADAAPQAALRIESFAGRRVLIPIISQSDLADEMFDCR